MVGEIKGNDNHIGHIGEYGVRRYYEEVPGGFRRYADKKTDPYGIELKDGTKVSVKTTTDWGEHGRGAQELLSNLVFSQLGIKRRPDRPPSPRHHL
jgi:hypothetical protein